ncbi:MAG: hypothetical protein KOO65_09580 [Desulfobacterales bacterium]|nr:hypothetical protein [Desulfobacterales bacterium]MBU8911504.1 hypothetical protein [Desulfobacterales bacterium]
MTITTYQVESVLKAYSKQTRVGNPIRLKSENLNKYTDIVTLTSEGNNKEAFDKISYSLLDILSKQTSSKS